MPRSSHPSTRQPPRLIILAASAVIALLCATASVAKITVFPPKLEKRDFDTAGAVTHAMVDLDRSRITDRSAEWAYFERIRRRADLLAQLMASAPALEYIARRAHISPDQIAVVAPFSEGANTPLTEPGSEQRAREILLARKRYRLEIQYRATALLDVYAQAPSTAEAERLAGAAIVGLQDYLRAVAVRMGVNPNSDLRLNQLGPARGARLTARAAPELVALTFLLTFALSYGGLRGLVAIRFGHRQVPRESPSLQPASSVVSPTSPATATAAVERGVRVLPPAGLQLGTGQTLAFSPAHVSWLRRRVATGDECWPRTTRVLPWMLAGFMAIVWLIPFDSIQLNVSSPIDLKLDRIVLPFIVLTWALSLGIGGRHAPRLRPTWIHASLGAFLVLACVSVILNAGPLNHALELETSLKKLPLLVSYVLMFVMTASVVRRDEVAAFIKYTLVLAVICALGMIWEDQLLHNLFFDWSQKVLPRVFEVAGNTSGWDSVGRRLVHGPATIPLAAAAMLSLAIPIAVLGVIHAKGPGERVLYGLAVCLLIVAVLATQRKTGLIAPVVGVLALAHFRRKELLRLVPVAVVAIVGLLIVSPGTLVPVLDQFRADNLKSANTVSDRGSDYDAIRPDVLTHGALGRGYGSYQPIGHRVLDSEVLVRVVEMGVLGLAAFVLVPASVLACARRTIHSRHPVWSPSALAGASAAIVFLVLATLFDSMAFPQVPYVFLSLAALVAVVVDSPGEGDRGAAPLASIRG